MNFDQAFDRLISNEGGKKGTTVVASVAFTTIYTVPDEPSMYNVFGHIADAGATYMGSAVFAYDGTTLMMLRKDKGL